MRNKPKWHSILLTGLALLLASSVVGCASTSAPAPAPEVPAEPEPAVEEPELAVASEGPAEKLMLQVSDIGPGWSRTGVQIKAEGCWTDQNFQRQRWEGDLLFSEGAVEILWVYPDADSAIANSELSIARYNTQTEVLRLEESLEELNSPGLIERYQSQLEYYQLDLPFWDEAYRHNDIMLRKDNIVVFLKVGRNILLKKYDPLTQSSPVLPYTPTPKQEDWLDREQFADDFLFSLAEKAEGRISDYLAEDN